MSYCFGFLRISSIIPIILTKLKLITFLFVSWSFGCTYKQVEVSFCLFKHSTIFVIPCLAIKLLIVCFNIQQNWKYYVSCSSSIAENEKFHIPTTSGFVSLSEHLSESNYKVSWFFRKFFKFLTVFASFAWKFCNVYFCSFLDQI